ncbi:hypothetical protein Pcinc_016225 [Petrolisthes cinctipes]|uniref:IGFBP N-terminal domain-containing protein n=1 Tax=Petrolisthes cinctipes TaxID=88211 RepID=A0AAE1FU31_PETCI|nr:hypothetical protein Pcinc_016225 [Petrolisthes cinctipes]
MAITCSIFTILVLLLLNITPRSWCIHCNCEKALCTQLSVDVCPGGTTHDLCGCCTVCAGVEGDDCGGPWGIYGECGTGLECRQDHCPPGEQDLECYHHYLTEPGQCVQKRRRSLILDVLTAAADTTITTSRKRVAAPPLGDERTRRRLNLGDERIHRRLDLGDERTRRRLNLGDGRIHRRLDLGDERTRRRLVLLRQLENLLK